MVNPLHPLAYRFMQAAMDGSDPASPAPPISRRGFLLMAASLSSCAAAAPLRPPTPAGRKTPANSAYRTPSYSGPVPRNPDLALSSQFATHGTISFSRVPNVGKFVAMTFDDGPHPSNTPRLLDILRARNIKATFFTIGASVDLYPQVLRRTVAEGHEIGNHSYSHRLLSRMSDATMLADLGRCHEAITRASGVAPRVMRPPYGGLLQRQRELLHSQFGYPTILWSVDPLDWRRPGPSAVASRIINTTTPGSIILAHDLHGQTVDAMPMTLDNLLGRGFQFVTVSQLLAMRG